MLENFASSVADVPPPLRTRIISDFEKGRIVQQRERGTTQSSKFGRSGASIAKVINDETPGKRAKRVTLALKKRADVAAKLAVADRQPHRQL
jgi:hypothetical protein